MSNNCHDNSDQKSCIIKYNISGLLEVTVDLVWKYFTTCSYVKNRYPFVVSVFEQKILKYVCFFITMWKFKPLVVATLIPGDHNLNKFQSLLAEEAFKHISA